MARSLFVVIALCLVVVTHPWNNALADNQPPARAELLGEKEALLFLKNMPRQWAGFSRYDCKTYEDKNIDLLARPFAMLAASFLKGFTETHGHATITSAHRNREEQKCVCRGEEGPCAGRGRKSRKKKNNGKVDVDDGGTGLGSRHSTGLALDVRAGTGEKEEFLCMHDFAKKNPIYGVHFPLGKRDYPHMEPTGRWGLRAYATFIIKNAVTTTPIVRCEGVERMYERTYDD